MAAELAIVEQQNQALEASFNSDAGFNLLWRGAKAFASSTLVPKDFRGNPSNCMIALNMAHQMKMDPLMCMQNLYVVHGQPSWSAKFLIACFNQCGRFSSIKFQFFGERGKDNWGCRATATELSTGEVVTGPEITIDLAKKEGWFAKNGSKWQTIPELMLRYRAAAWLVRTIAPEIAMGFHTSDEVRDGLGAYDADTEIIELPEPESKEKPVSALDAIVEAETNGETKQPETAEQDETLLPGQEDGDLFGSQA